MRNLKSVLAKNNRYIHLLVFALSIFIGGYMGVSLGQDVNYDLQNYHYENPYVFIHHRVGYDIAAAGIQSYENPLIDIPGYLAINHLKPRAAAGVLGMIQGINIWLVFEIALVLLASLRVRRCARYLVAGFIGILSFFGGANISEVGNTMGDNLISLFVLFALLLFIYSFDNKRIRYSERLLMCLAYFIMGVAVGLKLTASVFAIGLLLAGFAVRGNLKKKLVEQLFHGGAFAIGLIIAGGYWFIKMYVLYKNPVFPFYNGVFKSPYYPATDFVDTRWLPKDLAGALSRPFDLMSRQSISSEIAFKDPRLGILAGLLLAFIVFAIFRKLVQSKQPLARWSRAVTAFWVFVLVSYFLWLGKFGYYRYLLPIELLSLAAISTLLFGVIKKTTAAGTLLILISIYITTQTVAIDWGRVDWQTTYFGVAKNNFTKLDNATVLVAGHAPVGFLVPYFPASSETIRVGSDLSSPSLGTEPMQALMRQAVNKRISQGSPFYAIVADEDRSASNASFASYGFNVGACNGLPVYIRAGIQSKIRLCNLYR